MSTGLISKKYLIDIANAIRVMLDSESTYTPAQMATAIANIDGSITGTITKSSNADVGIITDTLLDDICDALRTKLGDNTLSFTPSQIADAILTISSGGGSVDIVPWSSGTDEQIVAMIQAAHNGDIDLQTDGGWAVGDTRQISISSFTANNNITVPAQNIDIVISQFGDYRNCGCVMQFDFKQCLSTLLPYHATTRSLSSYNESEIKSVVMPALVNALPSWLSDLLISFSTIGAYKWNPYYTTVSNVKLCLRAGKEIDSNGSDYSGQVSQIQYYANSSENRVKKQGINGSDQRYYTRDAGVTPSNVEYPIVCVSTAGSVGYSNTTDARNAYGIAPFGCL